MNDPAQRPRPRRGCLSGCLWGLLRGLVLLLVLGTVLIVAIDAAFAPWIYVVGGKFRPLPSWFGEGDAEGPGGRYALYVWFSPTPSGSHVLPSTDVLGGGYVCTPRGERISLRVTGGASGKIWRDMDGHEFGLSAYHRPVFWSFTNSSNWRPRLTLRGRWVGPNLVMSDEGGFAHAFLPDGSVNTQTASWYPKSAGVPITLTEVGWSWGYSCPRPKS
jgi:hypothetical protein